MGDVVFVDFSKTYTDLTDEFCIEIVDDESGDSYLYYDNDMIGESDFLKRF